MKKQTIVAVLLIILLQFSTFIVLRAEYNKPHCFDSIDNTSIESSVYVANNELYSSLKSTRNIKMTSLAYGGTGVLFTKVNNQFTAMTGGRGSATFNNRFTFGGAGWGMPKGVELESSKTDTLEFFKFGYGGLEFGYLLYASEKVSFGSHLLLACGAGFKESYPKTAGGFNLFPVIEPSVYSQISLGKLLKLDVGITYRYVTGSKFSYINNRQLSGPSIYLAFLVGTCSCN